MKKLKVLLFAKKSISFMLYLNLLNLLQFDFTADIFNAITTNFLRLNYTGNDMTSNVM